MRGLLFEAATVLPTRSSAESGLRTWRLKRRERGGVTRAAAAMARKLAVAIHAMLKAGILFDWSVGAAA
jgi:transposase